MILARTDSERIFMGKPKGGDQTEKPTPKRLKDARKEGEVHRSQELTNTLLLMLWLAMAPLLAGWVYQHLADAFEASFIGVGQHRPADLLNTLQLDLMLLMRAVLPLLIFASVVGIAADFLQLGPLFALKRLVPKMERINPVDGVKRMFSQENLVEVFKSIFKSAALLGIGVLVLRAMLPPILSLPDASPPDILHAWWRSLMWIGIWVVFVFFFVSVLDANYQRFVFIKNLMMSRRDIRDEMKTTEGDPMVKSRRRELHHEWSQQNMLASVRKSNVVVVNPTPYCGGPELRAGRNRSAGGQRQGRGLRGPPDSRGGRAGRCAGVAEHRPGARAARQCGGRRIHLRRLLRSRCGNPALGGVDARHALSVALLPKRQASLGGLQGTGSRRLKTSISSRFWNSLRNTTSTIRPSVSRITHCASQALIGRVNANTLSCCA